MFGLYENIFYFLYFSPTVVFSSTKSSDYMPHANNSRLFTSGEYRISSDGNLLRSFENIDLSSNIFLLFGITPNINFKYQIFSFPLHVLSFHFASSFSAKNIYSSRRYISIEKASIEKNLHNMIIALNIILKLLNHCIC